MAENVRTFGGQDVAVFIDFENVAMGVRESKYGNFDIDLVLKRLVEKGGPIKEIIR